MIKVVIIEDESLAVRNLVRLLRDISFEILVVEKLDSVKESIAQLPDLDFDLILMDIHLLDGNAFQILENLSIPQPIIFTTAFDKYAIKAFKQKSIDYLLKPVSKEELEAAIKKYDEVYKSKDFSNEFDTQLLKELILGKEYKTRYLVQIGKKMWTIETKAIAFFNIEDKSCFIHSFENKRYLISSNLSNIESEVDAQMFFRVNRQMLLNRAAIKNIYYESQSRLKVILKIEYEEIIWVPIDKIVKFKKWLET